MMPYEIGGRSSKNGNRYEVRVAMYHLIKLLEEKIDYIIIEAIGDEEQGIDLWIGNKDATKEGIQCKARNGSKEYWDFGSVNAKNIFTNWKLQLDREPYINVSLASPLGFTFLEDLIYRANNSNTNGCDFYEHQIKTSSDKFVLFTKQVCKVMGLDHESEHDLIRFKGYLKRIRYRQFVDYELRETILSKMDYLFLGNSKNVYDSLVSWIIDGDILGKRIDLSMLYQFFNDNQIMLKNLALDNRIVPQILELNREYKLLFQPLNSGIIIRDEFEECRKAIKIGKSLIIHGKAGKGKSGCTENIISYCEEENIRYLAIKLDKRIPSGTADQWGIKLDLPSSVVHCIHSIAINERAVIILDQLDALRWTQAHSRDALLVCSQIIEQARILNLERTYNISVVFVTRTYDLENDTSIKGIFKANENGLEWQKIHIGELNDAQVKDIVGEKYSGLSNKLKELLRSPSNIYIWQHLDQKNEYNECSTTNHLVQTWWKQLSENYFHLGCSESDLTKTRENLVEQFDKTGRVFIPVNAISSNISELEYLSSNGFLIIQDNKVSFAHQSVLDYWLANKMLQQYYSGQSIIDIIGSKEKQTPGRRYQLQMLMQNLIENESQDFLSAGLLLLDSEAVRFSNKFVFFEVLNQIDEIDANISSFIIENCEGKIWSSHLLNNVIHSRVEFYKVLRDANVLERWFNDAEKKDIVLNLIISIRPNYDLKDVEFIKKYAFKNEEDANRFAHCFYHDIVEDSDEMFELRMQFYQKYPRFANNYLNFKSMLKNCELRTIRYFTFLLENKIKNREKIIHRYEDEFLHDDSEFLIQNGEQVLKLLLPFLPKYSEQIHSLSEWSGRLHKDNIERACINIIKKANAAVISVNPELVLDIFKSFEESNNDLLNEILLDAFIKFPESYSNFIISYIFENFNKIIFDKTSGNSNELYLVKQVIGKHAAICEIDTFSRLEHQIIYYVSPKAKDIYMRRLEFNKQKNEYTAYWSFWGDLQYELLKALPIDRLSNHSKQLLQVLERRFINESSMYYHSSGGGGSVISPISGKKLSDTNWKKILLSRAIKNRKESSWKYISGGIIDNSREAFSRSFETAVAEEPENMLRLVLSIKESIDDTFIDALFSGIAHSNHLNDVNQSLIEQAILRHPSSYDSYRASSICKIIEKKRQSNWPQEIINVLFDIAINHHNPEDGKPNVTNAYDKEMKSFNMLFSNTINCIRGQAAEAIGALLWENSSYFYQFNETIERIINDDNRAVRLSSMFILLPVYNIERDWAADRILKLIEDDYVFAGFYDMRNMFFLLYSKYRDRIIRIIEKCYKSDDEDLVKVGAHCLAEMHILKSEIEAEMIDVDAMSKLQAEEVLLMVMLYFDKDEYNELAKEIICRFRNSELDLEMPISRLFFDNLINLERDEEFLLQVMNSKLSRRTIHAFIHYLEEESQSLSAYKNIIFALSESLITGDINSVENSWGIDDSISKLIIALYDEVSNSQQNEQKEISAKCLDLWDLMFKNQIGSARTLSQEMMQR